jgi:hypothetical protein
MPGSWGFIVKTASALIVIPLRKGRAETTRAYDREGRGGWQQRPPPDPSFGDSSTNHHPADHRDSDREAHSGAVPRKLLSVADEPINLLVDVRQEIGARSTVRRQRVIEFDVLTKLITTASPIAPRLYRGGNYAQERDDYVGSYRAATD